MREFALGLALQFRDIFFSRRFGALLVLLLLMSWMCIDIYANLIVRQMPVAILDLDRSKISRTLTTYIASTREVKVVRLEYATREEAMEEMVKGNLGAVVWIPPGLSERIKRGERAVVDIAVDYSNILTGKNLYKALARAVGTVSAGIQITMLEKLGYPKDKVMSRVAPVVLSENDLFNPATNYAIYILPGLILSFFNVYTLILALSVFLHKAGQETIRRLVGRLCSIYVVCLGLGIFYLYGLLPRAMIVPMTGFETVVRCLAMFVFLEILMASALCLASPKPLLALESVIVLGMLSLMFSGVTWPPDLFAPPLAFVANLLPFTPFAQGFQLFLHMEIPPDGLAHIDRMFRHQAVVYGVLLGGAILLRGLIRLVRARRAMKGEAA